jgi:uncharacterized protein (DUF111 family)
MGRILYLDCSAGVAGDMMLGGLIDAGLPLDALRAALGSLMLPGWTLESARVTRAGVRATKFAVRGPQDSHAGSGAADHHHHRTVGEICALVESTELSTRVKRRTCDLFTRLAEVEASIHLVSIEKIHLHEVGALDSIVDIAGSVFGLDWFAPERIVASPLNLGSGFVETTHGRLLPVPDGRVVDGILHHHIEVELSRHKALPSRHADAWAAAAD